MILICTDRTEEKLLSTLSPQYVYCSLISLHHIPSPAPATIFLHSSISVLKALVDWETRVFHLKLSTKQLLPSWAIRPSPWENGEHHCVGLKAETFLFGSSGRCDLRAFLQCFQKIFWFASGVLERVNIPLGSY